jgi:hypothetical protein
MERIRRILMAGASAAPLGLPLSREITMRKVWTLGLALASVAVLSSCSAVDALTGRVTGTYQLRSVNGSSLPALTYQEPGYSEEVLSATFSLESDGTYTDAAILRVTQNGRSSTTTSSSSGFYDEYNGEITFTDSGRRTFYGTVSGGRLVIDDDGLRMTYDRI